MLQLKCVSCQSLSHDAPALFPDDRDGPLTDPAGCCWNVYITWWCACFMYVIAWIWQNTHLVLNMIYTKPSHRPSYTLVMDGNIFHPYTPWFTDWCVSNFAKSSQKTLLCFFQTFCWHISLTLIVLICSYQPWQHCVLLKLFCDSCLPYSGHTCCPHFTDAHWATQTLILTAIYSEPQHDELIKFMNSVS